MDFDKVRTQSRRIRRQRTWLFLYAFAVTCALIVSVRNNNNVEASTPKNLELSEMAPEEFPEYAPVSADENFEAYDEDISVEPAGIVLDDSAKEALEPQEVALADENVVNEDIVTVAKGDSFIGILTNMGLSYTEATNIYTAFKNVFDARNIKVGQELYIASVPAGENNDAISVNKIVIEPVSGTRYIVEKNADGKYESRKEQDELVNDLKTVSGVINGNLSAAMGSAGVPLNVVGNFIDIFSFSVDFRRDIHAGDQFEVRYERKLAPDGSVVKTGDIIFAALQLGKDRYELYRFEDKSGNVDYYDEKGLALKKNLDRKPMEFKKARISSRFGRRFHPILKQYRGHDGVDYAAPAGTKIYASGDGVVTMAKWYGGYGKYVQIRHNSEYTTGYAHMRAFAKGIRPGVRVKQGQVIGYVGSTGRSTGPHLHFEVVRNGRKIDPLKVKAATGENLSGAKLAAFKKVVAKVKAEADQEKEFAAAETDEIGQVIESLNLAEQPQKNTQKNI